MRVNVPEADLAWATLERLAAVQADRMAWLRAHNVRFERNIAEPPASVAEMWEAVAFALYSDLAEAATLARTAQWQLEDIR